MHTRSWKRVVLKWSLLGTLCTTLLSAWVVQRALAELGQDALSLGPELERWAGLLGPANTIELNGHTLHLGSLHSELTVGDVMSRFRTLCTRESGGLAEELRTRPLALSEDEEALALGVSKQTFGEASGASACLARGATGGGRDLLARAATLLRTGDLSSLGQLRYVFARKLEDGRTQSVLVWNEGPLHVDEMFPASGDAAGHDLTGVPRPRGSRRLLSAQVAGQPYGLLAYEVGQEQPLAALDRYDTELRASGFQSVHLQPGDADSFESRAFVRDGIPLQVHALRHEEQTVIAVVRMGDVSHRRFVATP